ncbi:MAG: hypothetical protein ACREUQ_14770, partial [Burkholderiales bacterium]
MRQVPTEKAGAKYDSLQDFIAQAKKLEDKNEAGFTSNQRNAFLYYNPYSWAKLNQLGNSPSGESAQNLLAAGKWDELDKLIAQGPAKGREGPEWSDPYHTPAGYKRDARGALEAIPGALDAPPGTTFDADDPTHMTLPDGRRVPRGPANAGAAHSYRRTATGELERVDPETTVQLNATPDETTVQLNAAPGDDELQAASGGSAPGLPLGSSADEARARSGLPPTGPPGTPFTPPSGAELTPPTGGTLPPANTPGPPPEATGGPQAPLGTPAVAGPITGNEGPENILPGGGPPDRLQSMLQSEAERQLANPSVYDDELFKRATGEAKEDLGTFYDEAD